MHITKQKHLIIKESQLTLPANKQCPNKETKWVVPQTTKF